MHDLVITGAAIVDGSGGDRRYGDVAVDDGRISEIGRDCGPGRRTIDAAGRVLSPGFVDVHTHLDVQGFWDTTLSPTPLHGITTAVGGNCGFSVAPLRPETAGYLMRMLARVEDMPLESLADGVPWNWSSTAEYLDQVDRTLAINTGYMVGHSALRAAVMGADANQRPATDEEVRRMSALLADGLRAGGLGFSSTNSATHSDAEDRPVPSRHAERDEFVALAAVCRDHPGTSVEFIPGPTGPFGPGEAELMLDMSRAAQRPLNWNVMFPDAGNLEECLEKLALSTAAPAHGARIVALAITGRHGTPLRFRSFSWMQGFGAALQLGDRELAALLGQPEERGRLAAAADAGPAFQKRMGVWADLRVIETVDPSTVGYRGRLIGDIARAEGKSPFDVLCDLVVADGFRTVLEFDRPADTHEDWAARVKVWRTEGALVGGSDAGAHVEKLATFNYTSTLLQHAVREEGLLGLEEAVHLLTAKPAELYGLVDRGRIAVGAVADLVVFDEATVAAEPPRIVDDLPGGATRLYSGATGIGHVVVAGQEIVRDGAFTEARPGRVLRSGVDTTTPAMA